MANKQNTYASNPNIKLDTFIKKLDPRIITAVKREFPVGAQNEAFAIMYHESRGRSTATNEIGNSAGIDKGLFQINTHYHPEANDIKPDDIDGQVKAAADIWKKRGWKEWADATVNRAKEMTPDIDMSPGNKRKFDTVDNMAQVNLPQVDVYGKAPNKPKSITNSSPKNKLSNLQLQNVPNAVTGSGMLGRDTNGYKSNSSINTLLPNVDKSGTYNDYTRSVWGYPLTGSGNGNDTVLKSKSKSELPSNVNKELIDRDLNIPSKMSLITELGKSTDGLNLQGIDDIIPQDNKQLTTGTNKDDDKFSASDATSLLRFAPAVGSLYNMLDKDKAATIKLDRIASSNPLEAGQINQLGMNAQLSDQYNKTVGDITNMSGGSAGAARANVQAAGLAMSKAKANAFSNLNMTNISNKMQADQFNIGNENQINAGNTSISNNQKMINMRNKIAADAKTEADRNAFFSTLGNVGLEQFQGNIISGANNGYGNDIFGKSTFKGK